MNIVDSSGAIEYFTQGENAHVFTSPIRDLENLLVPNECCYDVFKRLLADLDEEAALLAVVWLSQGHEIVLNRRIALDAAQIARETKLAMADSNILPTARVHQATLWTQDVHFKVMERLMYIEKKG